jgi:lysophospholipid acyltransferase (LPLAT)-like uncharacterized protein
MSLVKRLKSSFRQRFAHRPEADFVPRLLSFLVPLLHGTWRVQVENEALVQSLVQEQGAVILVTWHGRMLVPIATTRNRGYYALVSRSGDGGMLSAIFERLGWRLIRGSTGRGAVEALRTGCEALAQPGTVLAFTPDGPRGPAGVAKPGMIYFAQKTGKPIVPVGVSARPRKLLASWDRFLIPLPFARCLLVYGEPIYARPGDDLQELTQRVQDAIHQLEHDTETKMGFVATGATAREEEMECIWSDAQDLFPS